MVNHHGLKEVITQTSKGALPSARVIFVNKTAVVLRIAINGSEQIAQRAIYGYRAYSERGNSQRGVNHVRHSFHLFLPFSILLQDLPVQVWKKSFQNRKNSELWSGIRMQE